MSSITGFIINFLSIVFTGDYLGTDGPFLQEDSQVYDLAYALADMI